MNINYNRCMDVVLLLNEYFSDTSTPACVDYPSNIEFKSNEYFIYMFYSCLLDYGMKSKIYHKNLINTYNKYSYIFNPKHVINMNEVELKDIIVNNIHPRYPNVALKKWVVLSKKLSILDDISDKLKFINSFTELTEFIKYIGGYGQKTGGLLIRIICDSKISSFNDNVKSIPIDRHDIEISYLTGVIDSKNVNNKEINDLSDVYVSVGEKLKINPSDIDKFLWEIGNTFCNKKNCIDCPLNSLCKKMCGGKYEKSCYSR